MAFSPETYALLNGKIATTTEELESELATKWSKGDAPLVTKMLDAIEASFAAASEKTVFSGSTTESYGCAWYGFKSSANMATALIFRGTSGAARIGVGYRTVDGWNYTVLF